MRKSDLIIITTVALVLSAAALAQESTSSDNGNSPFGKQLKNQRTDLVCERLTAKIDAKLVRYTENKERYLSKYNKVSQKIAGIVEKYEGMGYDVSALKTDLASFKDKVQGFTTAYHEYMTALSATRDYACGQSEGRFADSVKAALTRLQEVRKIAVQLRNQYRDQIRPDVLKLREQVRESKQSTESLK